LCGERLDLSGELERIVKRRAGRDLAMIGEKAGVTGFKRSRCMAASAGVP
jgi:hypothetical protein